MKKRFYIFLTALLIISAFFLPAAFIGLEALAVLVLLFFHDKNSLLKIKSYKNKIKTWLILILVLLIFPLFIGDKDTEFIGIPYSLESLYTGIRLVLRFLLVILSISLLKTQLKSGDIEGFWAKIGLREFPVIFERARNFFPEIKDIMIHSFKKYKSENGKRAFLKNIMDFLSQTLAEILKLALKER